MPSGSPQGYATPTELDQRNPPPVTGQQVEAYRGNFIELILREVVKGLVGVFLPGAGPAIDQLFNWANDLVGNVAAVITDITQLITSIGGEVISDVGDAINGAVTGLAQLTNDLLHNAASVIGSIPQNLVIGLNSTVSALNSGISAATAFVQSVIDALLGALRGIPVVGGLVPDLSKAIKKNVVNQQNFTISGIVSTNRNPSWVCRYPISDVTYAEAWNNQLSVFGTTDNASTGTAHTHALNVVNDVEAEPAGWSINQNESRGSYLTIQNATVHDTVGTVAWIDGGTINNVYLEIFKENSDTSLTRIYSKDISGDLTTATAYLEYTLPERLIVQEAERYVLRVRNSSSTATIVRIAGMKRVASSPDIGFKTSNATDSGRTEYTSAQAASARDEGLTLNWFMLAAKSLPTTARSYSDDANRNAIGGLWVGRSSTAATLDVYAEAFGYTGSDDGDQSAIYIHPTNGTVSRVEANLYINELSSARCGIMLHCSRDFEQVVYLGVDRNSAKIYSGSAESLTERASISIGGTGLWAMYYDEVADKYVALKDGAVTGLEWTGVSTAVHHGRDYQYGGIRISLASLQAAGTIDNWTLSDWYIAVPATVAVPRMEATAAMLEAIVKAGASISAPRMAATASMPSPSLTAGVNFAAPQMTAAADMPDPTVSAGDVFPYIFDFTLG